MLKIDSLQRHTHTLNCFVGLKSAANRRCVIRVEHDSYISGNERNVALQHVHGSENRDRGFACCPQAGTISEREWDMKSKST